MLIGIAVGRDDRLDRLGKFIVFEHDGRVVFDCVLELDFGVICRLKIGLELLRIGLGYVAREHEGVVGRRDIVVNRIAISLHDVVIFEEGELIAVFRESLDVVLILQNPAVAVVDMAIDLFLTLFGRDVTDIRRILEADSP